MGWLGAAVPEAYGGAGFGHLELVLIAQELGRALAPIPFSLVASISRPRRCSQFGSDAQKKKYLPRLASGELIGTFALAERAGDIDASSATSRRRFAAGRAHGHEVPGARRRRSPGSRVVVAKERQRATRSRSSSSTATGVERDAALGARSTRRGSRAGSRSTARAAERLANGAGEARDPRDLLDRAAVLMAFEQIGGAERALEVTREFTLDRYAFGRPVASFQAIKHRLADLYAAIAARALERLLRRLGALDRQRRARGRRVRRARRGERGVRARGRGDDPDARRRRLHVGVRLPSLLPPRASCSRSRSARRASGARSWSRASTSDSARALSSWRGLTMDFNDTPRRSRRSAPRRAPGSEATPSCARPGEIAPGPARASASDDGLLDARQALAGEEGRRAAGRAHLAEGVRRPRRLGASRT